jgi:Mg2+ and Co2+ transporter CorA
LNVGFARIYQTVIYGFLKGLRMIKIMLQLHSKAPTKEIKKNWELFTIFGIFVLIMNLITGTSFIFNIKIPIPYNEFLNSIGGYIFLVFVIVLCITQFRNKKNLNTTN